MNIYNSHCTLAGTTFLLHCNTIIPRYNYHVIKEFLFEIKMKKKNDTLLEQF
jgi:hypothetical protein